jgi:hypothetical protein
MVKLPGSAQQQPKKSNAEAQSWLRNYDCPSTKTAKEKLARANFARSAQNF